MNIFKYSPRKVTKAADMENQVSPQIKHERSEKLLQLNKENFMKFASKSVGKEFEVLFEQEVGDDKYEGLTPNYLKTFVTCDEDICGKIMKVKITEVKDEYVEGILV